MKSDEINNSIEWSILVKSIDGSLSDDEMVQLELWLRESDRHRKYYDKMVTQWTQEVMGHRCDMKERIAQFESFVNNDLRRTRRQQLKRLFTYAAILVVAFLVISPVLFFNKNDNKTVIVEAKLPVIKAGGFKAMIIASDGSTLNIEDIDKKVEIDGASVEKNNGTLNYAKSPKTTAQSNSKKTEVQYNTIVIPKGGEYKVVLEDGTQVWLNSNSKLIFPVKFSNSVREVQLEGEGYFEVSKESTRPFVVTTAKSKIRVYGTSFNVSSYLNDAEDEVITLATGRIGVTVGDSEYLLEPRQQIVMSKDSVPKIHEVNPKYYCEWNRGIITFENESLDDIMRKLSRWYEIEVDFDDEVLKELIFTGDLDRYTNFNEVLNMICQTTNIAYRAENGAVVIYRTLNNK